MKTYFKTIIRWPFGCLIFLLIGCGGDTHYNELVVTKKDSIAKEKKIQRAVETILLAGKEIKSGYIITRTGNDFTSESLRSLNQRNQTYSHCGIASIEHDSLFVYHALGGEWNRDQKIRRDPLIYFADPYNNRGFGIFSFEFSDSAATTLVNTVKDFYRQGIMFDMDFDLKTDDRMYCAEFVVKSLEKASSGKLVFNHSHINQFEFVGVDDIFLHPSCVMKREIVYK